MLFTLKHEGNLVKQKDERHQRQIVHFVLLLLSLVIILTGCASTGVRLPNVQEKKSVLLKEKTIVLLRLKVERDGEPFNPFKRYGFKRYGGTYTRFQLKLANMDKGEYPRYITLDNSHYSIPAASPSWNPRKKAGCT